MQKKIITGILILLIVAGTATIIGLYYIGDFMLAQVISGNIVETAKSEKAEKSDKFINIDEQVEKLVDDVNIGGKNETEEQPVTVKDLKKVNDNIPKVEKVKIAATALEKLNIEEISELRNMAHGGITYQEKLRIKQILKGNFSDKEIQAMKNTFYRYRDSRT